MKKKIIALCLIVALAATAVIGGTLAYFTDTDDATNTFTVGNVDITLTEPNWEGSGSKDAPEVYPGEALAKDPTVKNTGANPCFVRVKVTGLDCLGNAGNIIYRTDYKDNKLGDNWVDGGDGYFYYNKVLAVGATTDALFDQIVIPTALTNGDAPAPTDPSDPSDPTEGNEDTQPAATKYNVVVTAEAVQAQGAKASWSAVQTMTLAEIQAWFATCMPSGTGA